LLTTMRQSLSGYLGVVNRVLLVRHYLWPAHLVGIVRATDAALGKGNVVVLQNVCQNHHHFYPGQVFADAVSMTV